MKFILYPFTLLYRSLFYLDSKFTERHTLPVPVISVGNITWGGTGKTPVVIKIAKELIEMGLKPAVLTRGFKRKNAGKSSLVVSDGSDILVGQEEAGDEPYLIAQSTKGAIVIVGPDRNQSALIALEKYSADIFILDDGFQHWKIARDLDIVCINAVNPFGNGELIPSGILREPVSSLKRAGLIILTSSNLVKPEEIKTIEEEIRRYNSSEILLSKYEPIGITRINDGKAFNMNQIQNKEVLAVSAIGENKNFRETLTLAGVRVRQHIHFRDHHWFSEPEINEIIAQARSNEIIISTAKDAIRLKKSIKRLQNGTKDRFYCLDIDVKFTKGAEIWQKEIKKISRSS